MSKDKIELDGVVVDYCKGSFFVQVNDNYTVLATLSGKIRQHEIKILVGDKVKVEVGEYDTSRGRIVSRLKS
jgi:translation initiation factor IF-1